MNVAPASGAARFGIIADWNAVEFARRLYGLAVSASTPPGRLHLHPIEFNKQSRCHGSLSKRREAANIYSLTAEARGPDQRRCEILLYKRYASEGRVGRIDAGVENRDHRPVASKRRGGVADSLDTPGVGCRRPAAPGRPR